MEMSFTKHPEAVGETFAEHFVVATSIGGAMILGGLACMIHGVLPFLFTSTGSKTIKRLHERMVVSPRSSGDRTHGLRSMFIFRS